MRTQRKIMVLILGLLSMFAGEVAAGVTDAGGPVLLVIPTRYTIVQFANDVATLRETYIVSFEKSKDGALHLYVWDRAADDWVKTDLDSYAGGGLFAVPPVEAFLIGADSDVPPALVTATSFCEMKRIPNLNLVPIANTLNESLQFQASEWRWLAGRYKMQVVDLNEDRRRYGRYGKPGAEGSQAPTDAQGMEEEIDAIIPEAPAPKMPGAKEMKAAAAAPAALPAAVPEVEDKQAMDK